MKPMSQDSFSGGVEYQLAPTIAAVRQLHPQQPDPHDRGRRPAAATAARSMFTGTLARASLKDALLSTPTPSVQDSETEAAVRRAAALAEPPVLGQLVPWWQLRPEPAVRQLRGHRQLGRNPHPGFSSFAVISSRARSRSGPAATPIAAFDLDEMMWDAQGQSRIRRAVWQQIVRTSSSCTARIWPRSARRSA